MAEQLCGVFSTGGDVTFSEIDLSNKNKVSIYAVTKRTASNGVYAVEQYDSSAMRIALAGYTDGRLYAVVCNGSSASYGSIVLDNTTVKKLLMVYDGTQSTNAEKLKLFVDGVEQTLAFNGNIPTSLGDISGDDFGIGKHDTTNPNASIADVRVYDDAITWEQLDSADKMFWCPNPAIPYDIVNGYYGTIAGTVTEGTQDESIEVKMADIQTFKAELTNIIGYAPTDANAKEILVRACYDVINRFKKINPTLLDEFTSSADLIDGNGYDLVANFVYSIRDVVRIDSTDSDRQNMCVRVGAHLRAQCGDSDSIYLATNHTPVYYILNEKLFVLPAPTASPAEKAVLAVVKISDTVTNYDSGVSTIAGFPESYNYFIILYTANHLLLEKIAEYADDSDIDTAFTAAKAAADKFAAIITSMGTSASAGDALLDGIDWSDFATAIGAVTTMISAASVGWEAWITAEDAEMAQAKIGGIQSRIAEAQSQIAKIAEIIKQAGTYSATNQAYAMQADAVSKELSGYLQLIQTHIADIASNVEITKTNAAAINMRYERLFVPYSQAEERKKDRSI